MDTLFVLVLTVIIMSVVMVVLLLLLQEEKENTNVLLGYTKHLEREVSHLRLAENMATVSESIKEREHILQISSEQEKLLDKSLDLGPRTSAL